MDGLNMDKCLYCNESLFDEDKDWHMRIMHPALIEIKVGDKLLFKGIKSRGDSWQEFITNPHFYPRTKDDIYGIAYALQGKDVWVNIYDFKTNELLDKSTWGFLKDDLIDKREVIINGNK